MQAAGPAHMPGMIPLSVLDLSPIPEGSDAGQALRQSRDLARHVDALGYRRFWMAEHHNMPGIASAATAVALAHVAEGTQRIRIGAGGIMLPNHAPLVIAEQFGTLAALYPGRVDLGLGRAPGTDQVAARALRRNLAGEVDDFPRDVVELIEYFRPAEPDQVLRAVPGAGEAVEVWILGSSTFGAQLAAALGLPYAFASHFAPDQLDQALELYRRQFRPSPALERPHVMAAMNVVCADSDEEAVLLGSSMDQSFVALRTGSPGRLKPPVRDFRETLAPESRAMLEHMRQASAVGSPATVRDAIAAFVARTGADEIVTAGAIHDPDARVRSLELAISAIA